MSVPKPPFHTASEELLYNIYLKIQNVDYLRESDISTLAKLNAILTDADLMKMEDILSAINAVKGNVPEAGNTLEKLFNIVQGLTFLKEEDIDTLAELNAILSDADLIKTEDFQNAIAALKGNAPVVADTLEKIYNLLQPILSAWVQDGNNVGATKPIGTKDNFPLPFITANVERGRFDVSGNFLIGYSGAAIGKIHLRTSDSLEANYAAYIEDPILNILFGITNSGKFLMNKGRSNLLINGGWTGMTGLRNLILTSGTLGAKMVDTGSDNIIVGYNAASSSGSNPARGLARNVVIGTEAGSSDNNGTNYADCVYVGYRAGWMIGFNTGQRNTMVGASAGATAAQSGTDHTLVGYDAQNARSNSFNTLLGSGTRAYNSFGDLTTNGGGQNYMTAIGAGAIVRTPGTIVLGRSIIDQVVIGAERNNQQLPGTSFNFGFSGYRLHVIASGASGLGVSGSSFFRDGNFSINLGEDGSSSIKNAFRVNSYVAGLGGFDYAFSANNLNATIEITDYLFGGTKNEMLRLSPAGYANTGILVRPNDGYNAAYGYRYILEGTNTGQQSRNISAFHAQLTFPIDDSYPDMNRAQLFVAKANATNHYLDGFYADVVGSNPTSQVYAFYANNGKSRFRDTAIDGTLFVNQLIQLSNFNVLNHGKIYTDNVFINFVSGSFRGMQFWTTGGNDLLLRLGNTAIFETGVGLIHNDAYVDDAGGKGYLMIDGTKYTRSGTIWWGDPVGEGAPRENSLFPNSTRSLGARLILKRINIPNTGDYAIGYESNFLWLSASKNDNTNGFKFYGKDVQVLKLLGDGTLVSPATAAHYFGDENTDGTWRIVRSANDFVFQRRETGIYVTKQTIK